MHFENFFSQQFINTPFTKLPNGATWRTYNLETYCYANWISQSEKTIFGIFYIQIIFSSYSAQ